MRIAGFFFSFAILASGFAKADDFILCRYHGANYPAIKINTKDLEVGKWRSFT